jgi:hypothetical protein
MLDDSHIQAPLAPFMGQVPEASAWFTWALAQVPLRSFINVEGVRIETLVWGEAGRSGLLCCTAVIEALPATRSAARPAQHEAVPA